MNDVHCGREQKLSCSKMIAVGVSHDNGEEKCTETGLVCEPRPPSCVDQVRFVEQQETGIPYQEMKINCAERAPADGFSIGYPAFFRTQEDYDTNKESVSTFESECFWVRENQNHSKLKTKNKKVYEQLIENKTQ